MTFDWYVTFSQVRKILFFKINIYTRKFCTGMNYSWFFILWSSFSDKRKVLKGKLKLEDLKHPVRGD